MRATSILLYVVTDRPRQAAVTMFGLDLAHVPIWAKICHQPDDILSIPDGARAIAIWFGERTFLQDLWIQRRTEIRIAGEGWQVWDALDSWRKRRADAVADPDRQTAPSSPAEQPPAPAPPVEPQAALAPSPAPVPSPAAVPKQPRWL